MKLEDALFNWLQIKHVADARPEDQAAQETYLFFTEILEQDFKLVNLEINQEGAFYKVTFLQAETSQEHTFPVEFVHQLLKDIESEPKYN